MGSNAQPVAICVLKQLQHCVENLPRGYIDQCKIPALRSATLVASVCPDTEPTNQPTLVAPLNRLWTTTSPFKYRSDQAARTAVIR
jgi:hypothetical protein